MSSHLVLSWLRGQSFIQIRQERVLKWKVSLQESSSPDALTKPFQLSKIELIIQDPAYTFVFGEDSLSPYVRIEKKQPNEQCNEGMILITFLTNKKSIYTALVSTIRTGRTAFPDFILRTTAKSETLELIAEIILPFRTNSSNKTLVPKHDTKTREMKPSSPSVRVVEDLAPAPLVTPTRPTAPTILTVVPQKTIVLPDMDVSRTDSAGMPVLELKSIFPQQMSLDQVDSDRGAGKLNFTALGTFPSGVELCFGNQPVAVKQDSTWQLVCTVPSVAEALGIQTNTQGKAKVPVMIAVRSVETGQMSDPLWFTYYSNG